MALGGYAMTAITALTAQNTRGVSGVLGVPPDFLRAQLDSVMGDIGADAIKTGMLPDAAAISVVVDFLAAWGAGLPVVVDPVMVATSGDRLQASEAVAALRDSLIPHATLITPNIPEAALLLGSPITDTAGQRAAAVALLALGCEAVLVKGGHLEGAVLTDVLATPGGVTLYEGPRIDTTSTHGTGCTLASAIATGLAAGLRLDAAIRQARAYVAAALHAAPGLGGGHGPLGHEVTVDPARIAALTDPALGE
jgi:hydroxymethylpyrimidine/phosphomethylpyrimidine kinase